MYEFFANIHTPVRTHTHTTHTYTHTDVKAREDFMELLMDWFYDTNANVRKSTLAAWQYLCEEVSACVSVRARVCVSVCRHLCIRGLMSLHRCRAFPRCKLLKMLRYVVGPNPLATRSLASVRI